MIILVFQELQELFVRWKAQRIRLATQIGSGLVGVAYIMDDQVLDCIRIMCNQLLATLKHLRDLGNTLIVVEHDEDTMVQQIMWLT